MPATDDNREIQCMYCAHMGCDGSGCNPCGRCNSIGEIIDFGAWMTCPTCNGQCYLHPADFEETDR